MAGLEPLLKYFKVRVGLTGTPTPLHVGDLYGQVYACDDGRRLGDSITRFRQKYMRAKWLPTIPAPIWEPQDNALENVLRDLDGMALRIATTGNLVMPELMHNTIKVKLPATAMNDYRVFKRDMLIQINGNEVVAENAATAATKLRQIASGVVYTKATEEVVHDAKVEALIDLLQEQQGSPLLIAVAFRSEAAYLVKRLKAAGFGTVPTLMGGMSDAAANKVIQDWNAGTLPAVVCHPETVAHGLNLQAGGHSVCWFSMTYNLEHYIQFNARVWRQGQPSPYVMIHHIAAQQTVDEHVASVIESKDARQEALFEALLNHVKE
jgi:SNF2 family DNA or RNA helicase